MFQVHKKPLKKKHKEKTLKNLKKQVFSSQFPLEFFGYLWIQDNPAGL